MNEFIINNTPRCKVSEYKPDPELYVFSPTAGLESSCGGVDGLEPGFGPEWWAKLG